MCIWLIRSIIVWIVDIPKSEAVLPVVVSFCFGAITVCLNEQDNRFWNENGIMEFIELKWFNNLQIDVDRCIGTGTRGNMLVHSVSIGEKIMKGTADDEATFLTITVNET
ncbi:hypothetical protein K439DRAFT_1618382 [Ramaria rubella]|nr:hypothetical protein K439DRAFT_1618382 [Ramaria rubella]